MVLPYRRLADLPMPKSLASLAGISTEPSTASICLEVCLFSPCVSDYTAFCWHLNTLNLLACGDRPATVVHHSSIDPRSTNQLALASISEAAELLAKIPWVGGVGLQLVVVRGGPYNIVKGGFLTIKKNGKRKEEKRPFLEAWCYSGAQSLTLCL
jgi:hypothetical protein